jgi:hypothetical protein
MLIQQDVTDEIVVLIKGRKIVVPAAVDTDERNFTRVKFLQGFAVPDGDEPVSGAMYDIGMAVHMPYPPVGAQMVAENKTDWQNRKKPFHYFFKVIIRGIQNQIAGLVFGSHFGGKATAHAASIYNDVMFGILLRQPAVNKLHIAEHFFFTALAGAFAESAVIHQHHIIFVAVKITGIFGPAFNAPGIAVKIEDESFGIVAVKMQGIDADTRRNIKKIFLEGYIVPELKILFQFFRFKDQSFLYKICNDTEQYNAGYDIPDEDRQATLVLAILR